MKKLIAARWIGVLSITMLAAAAHGHKRQICADLSQALRRAASTAKRRMTEHPVIASFGPAELVSVVWLLRNTTSAGMK